MNFVFDENSDNMLKQAMLTCFDRIKEDLSESSDPPLENMGELSFGDSEKAAPIQATDLLAYQAHQYAKEATGNKDHPVLMLIDVPCAGSKHPTTSGFPTHPVSRIWTND